MMFRLLKIFVGLRMCIPPRVFMVLLMCKILRVLFRVRKNSLVPMEFLGVRMLIL